MTESAPRFTSLEERPDGPGCASRDAAIALRDHQIDLLSRSQGDAIEAAFTGAARARAAEAELGRRVAAERAIPGLVELQSAEAAG